MCFPSNVVCIPVRLMLNVFCAPGLSFDTRNRVRNYSTAAHRRSPTVIHSSSSLQVQVTCARRKLQIVLPNSVVLRESGHYTPVHCSPDIFSARTILIIFAPENFPLPLSTKYSLGPALQLFYGGGK